MDTRLTQSLEAAAAQAELQRSLLRLTSLLQRSLPTQTTTDLLLNHPTLLSSLRRAHGGNYAVVLSLLGVLDHGPAAKRTVDAVVDACDHVMNLRESVLSARVEYALASSRNGEDDAKREAVLERAVRGLEK